MKDFDD